MSNLDPSKPPLLKSRSFDDTIASPRERKKIMEQQQNAKSLVVKVRWGETLQQIMEEQRKTYPYEPLPLFAKLLILKIIQKGLAVEGIFRVSGDQARLKTIKTTLLSGGETDLSKIDIIDSSGLLKSFFRDLGAPILTYELFEHFHMILDMDKESQFEALQLGLNQIPKENTVLLKELLHLMTEVKMNKPVNMMTLENCATCLGSALIWSLTDENPPQKQDSLRAPIISKLLLNHFNELYWDEEEANTTKPLFVHKLCKHKKSIHYLLYHTGFKEIWSIDSSSTINRWCPVSCENRGEIKIEAKMPLGFLAIDNDIWIANTHGVTIWKFDGTGKAECQKTLEVPGYSLLELNDQVVIGSDNCVKFCDKNTKAIGNEVQINGSVTSISSNSTHVWVATDLCSIYGINRSTLAVDKEIEKAHGLKINKILCVNSPLSGDQTLLSCSEDRSIKVWDLKTLENKYQIENAHDTPRILSLVQIGDSEFWSCSWSGDIKVWNLESYEQQFRMEDYHTDAVSCLLPVYDEKKRQYFVWSGSWDRSLCIWATPKN